MFDMSDKTLPQSQMQLVNLGDFIQVSLYFVCIRDPTHIPGGELVLGGTDSNYHTGSFHYISTKEEGKWEILMKGWDHYIITFNFSQH